MNYLKNVYRILFSPNINSIILCRLALMLNRKGHKLLARYIKNRIVYRYGIHLGLDCKLGDNINFPHPQGIIIGKGTIIGSGCTIYQQVTFGKKNGDLDSLNDYPHLGKNVTVFAGAKIIGDIEIGENSVIAANSVVISNVEPNSVYGGIPAKKLKNRDK